MFPDRTYPDPNLFFQQQMYAAYLNHIQMIYLHFQQLQKVPAAQQDYKITQEKYQPSQSTKIKVKIEAHDDDPKENQKEIPLNWSKAKKRIRKCKLKPNFQKFYSDSHQSDNEVKNEDSEEQLQGHWTPQEIQKYQEFVDQNKDIFQSKFKKKSRKIFKKMAELILTRNASQCRSHHQKVQYGVETQEEKK